jgi:hypothetical protein
MDRRPWVDMGVISINYYQSKIMCLFSIFFSEIKIYIYIIISSGIIIKGTFISGASRAEPSRILSAEAFPKPQITAPHWPPPPAGLFLFGRRIQTNHTLAPFSSSSSSSSLFCFILDQSSDIIF